MTHTDITHDASARSWVASANQGGDFPLQNLPFGVFRRGSERARGGIAIGDRVLDVSACLRAGLFTGDAAVAAEACADESLNRLAALGRLPRAALRRQAFELLREGDARIQGQHGWKTHLVPALDEVEMILPMAIGDYSDFYASIHHAQNLGSLFRPDQPLLPNYKHVPIGYHGRASSIVVSGAAVRRPKGQTRPDEAAPPKFGPSQVLDYEVEAGFFVGTGNGLGEPIPVAEAEDHLFGLCLLNDWSARDIQKWEYQPLGPFLGKSFATTISPWIVTLEALAPYRAPAFARPPGDPAPLPYLDQGALSARAGFDVAFEMFLLTPKLAEAGQAPFRVSRGTLRDLYWSPGQLVAHHASNGCNLRPGDLIGSGTISGATPESQGSLIERTRGGKEPLVLPNGETRRFLLDGDEVILRGFCEAPGFARIGLGECRGRVVAARE